MKKIFILTVFSLLLFIKTIAQSNLPPVYEIKTDTVYWNFISSHYYQMLEDKEGVWAIGQITQIQLVNNFHDSSKSINSKVNTYWFRYSLKNAMDYKASICLNSMSDYDDFYVSGNNGNWDHYITGGLVKWYKKDGLKAANCIPVVINPGQTFTIYQRVNNIKSGLPEGFQISVLSYEKTVRQSYIDYVHNNISMYSVGDLQDMFLEGVLLIAIFINLLFYKIVKEKEYLYFSLFLLFLGIDRFITLISESLSWQSPELNQYVGYINLSWIFILIFLVAFIQSFFKTRLKHLGFSRFLMISAIVAGAFNVYATFTIDPCFMCGVAFPTTYLIYCTMLSIVCFSVLIIFILYVRDKNRFNKLVIIGGWPLMLVWGIGGLMTSAATFAYYKYGAKIDWTWFAYFRPVEVTCLVWFVFFFSLILFLRFTELRKENAQQALDKERLAKEKETERAALIEQQKIELEKTVEKRTAELKHSLENLQLTQAQLIQSEKMASLGELTAGIAHEIQNPLNFVNNFSEVNKELLTEMKDEIDKGNINEAKTIANDVIDNEEKINHHGKRADAIVKGMLQHSRSSTGVKEPTDINALADEYLRLAYHGLRAKDKNFNATMKTDFDESIEKINIIPQDIGRVLLNLYTNAFYAVQQKQKEASSKEMTSFEKMSSLYEPTISVSTKKTGNRVSISVSDNGNGILQKIVDKIFQPFFTTKPTGQGTGLGLSLSYDIIKAHGGEIKVETKEGEGTEFVIHLPITA